MHISTNSGLRAPSGKELAIINCSYDEITPYSFIEFDNLIEANYEIIVVSTWIDPMGIEHTNETLIDTMDDVIKSLPLIRHWQ